MKTFLKNMQAVLAKLGLQAKFDARDLTAEEQAALIGAYNEAHGDDAFVKDYGVFQSEQEQARAAEQQDRMFRELASILGTGTDGTQEDSAAQILSAVKELQGAVEKMGAASQGDTPAATVQAPVRASCPHTKDFAFGVRHSVFAAGRRYNRIAITRALPSGNPTQKDEAELKAAVEEYSSSLCARLNEHIANGTLHSVIKGEVDYSALTSDTEIGTRQFTVRQDALIARIVTLPNLDGLFPKISNIQSGQIITNVLFTEISQAYQKGRVFKGDVKFLPEKGIVDKVMAKVQFEDMSAIERSYLNYLNRSGSDPIKWSLIEWLILELAKQISNERIRRSIMGHYVKPVEGKAGHTMFASTGIVHRLIGLFDEKKVLPFLDEDLASYTKEDIGEVLILFAEMLAARTEDWKQYIIYVNENHRPWFKAWYKAKYGTQNDFAGVKETIPDYELPIRWVPCMGDLKLIFASVENNITRLENVPGEEYKANFQRDLEEVIEFSYWMEGAGVGFSGVKKDSLEDLKAADAREQMVFMSWPASVLAEDATTADASKGILFTTTAGKAAAATLTDITGAKEGVVYRIENGASENATKIAKAGKFSELKNAWEPTKVGEFIKFYYDAEAGKFYEIVRG